MSANAGKARIGCVSVRELSVMEDYEVCLVNGRKDRCRIVIRLGIVVSWMDKCQRIRYRIAKFRKVVSE